MTDSNSFAKTGNWDGSDSEPTATDPALAPPTHVGRYRIERVLGTGGFGVVYLATDEQLARQVAIKIPHRYLIESNDNVADYLREARTVANLDHVNIVPVHDVNSTAQFPCYVVSKYIEGGDLAETMRSNPLNFIESIALIATIAEALHYAHDQGVVHRDIKPSNILLSADRTPYLVDFGLALREGDPKTGKRYVGTPAYSSPEQARGEGHRIDGRSDLFSLGVVMYELLAGCKPFIANSTEGVLEAVMGDEPKPLRQLNASIPKELERICLRALCKRASERYPNGKELAEDLRFFLQSTVATSEGSLSVATVAAAKEDTNREKSHTTVRPPSEGVAPKIVPKGLRSFDVDDAEFFVELLPGPRDRNGVPDSIRFWLTRIQTPHMADNCPVGVVYGPSGCGKSSLIKAGIMPRLDASVMPVYAEATRHDTERSLLRSLRHAYPDVSQEDGLAATLAAIRRGAKHDSRRKVLLVIDQFEQWLHEHESDDETELMRALRQCDGRYVQAILLVRDDFWMAISHFMGQLDIPLVETQNTMSVPLFDGRHATKVLESFGRAYGALPAAPASLTADQKKFLDFAVHGLAKDGKVICLDIALLADMLSDKPWRAETWRAFGGTRGVGVQFLEDAFSSRAAPADSRVHNHAAQAVLRLLLPDLGNDLKGHSRTKAELFAASGYQHRKDFDSLLALLDHKLRLITPVAQTVIHRTSADDSQSSQPQETLYQLTHDFLVHAVQEWLKRKQEETPHGRAQRRLAELTSMYSVSPSKKLLPSTWEYVRLRTWTDSRRWSSAEKQLMQAAGQGVARRWLLASVGLAMLLAAGLALQMIVARQAKEQRVDGLVARLLDADLSEVEGVTTELRRQGAVAQSRLMQIAADAERPDRQRLRAHLSLIDRHHPSAKYVAETALHSKPDEVAILCKFLGEQSPPVAKYVTDILDSDVTLDVQLHAAAILAQLQGNSGLRNSTAAARVATALVEQNQLAVSSWLPLLAPASDTLQTPLESFFAIRDNTESSHNAAIALAGLCADDPEKLTDLALIAEPQQFVVLFPALNASPETVSARLRQALDAKPESPWPRVESAQGQRQLPTFLQETIESSNGLVDEDFILVQQLPWNDFHSLATSLAEFGYRPVIVRPYAGPPLQVAAIWSRDGDQWDLVSDASAEEVMSAHQRNRDRGWIARDIARYKTTAADGTTRTVFAALWSPVAEHENVTEAEMYVAVPESEHESVWQPLNARGFIPRINFKFHDDSGQARYTSIRWRLSRQFGYRDCWDAESFQSADLLDPWNWRQSDARIADDGSGFGPKIAATWWQDPKHTARFVHNEDLHKHLAECVKLTKQGYRPSSISVYRSADIAAQQATSVWYRPVPEQAIEEAAVAKRANALIGLWRLGHFEVVRPWLTKQSDQRVRSEFIHLGARMGVSAESLSAAFARERDVVAQQSLLAALTHFRPEHLTQRERSDLETTLLELFRTNPHPGLHSHIELLLRRWNRADATQQINNELAAASDNTAAKGKDWFVTPGGMTMSIIHGPADFLMGSPLHELGRDEHQEVRHLRRVGRTFALGTREVMVTEYLRFRSDFDYPTDYSPSPDCPIEHLDWYAAVRFCRWLSDEEHVAEAEMCYPPLDQIGDGMIVPDDFLDRTGYRLPTEAEWEYACRAASETSRHYGDQASLLGDYAWTAENSNYRASPVARLLPNDFGLFDMLGNVMEWCHDKDTGYPTPSVDIRYDDNRQTTVATNSDSRVTRGGAFLYQPSDARSAQRYSHFITSRRPYLGFRVARTIRPADRETSN